MRECTVSGKVSRNHVSSETRHLRRSSPSCLVHFFPLCLLFVVLLVRLSLTYCCLFFYIFCIFFRVDDEWIFSSAFRRGVLPFSSRGLSPLPNLIFFFSTYSRPPHFYSPSISFSLSLSFSLFLIALLCDSENSLTLRFFPTKNVRRGKKMWWYVFPLRRTVRGQKDGKEERRKKKFEETKKENEEEEEFSDEQGWNWHKYVSVSRSKTNYIQEWI